MESLLTFAKEVSPIGVIALLVIVILQLVRSSGIIVKLRGTQINDKEKVFNKEITDSVDLNSLNIKLDKIANNHLHELPELTRAVHRIEEEQIKQGNRLTSVETKMEFILNK